MEKQAKWWVMKKRIKLSDPIESVRVRAQLVYDTTGKLADFAVYSASEYDDARFQEAVRVIYFSPVAAQFCSTITHDNEFYGGESDPPSGKEEGFRLIVGKEDEAWALQNSGLLVGRCAATAQQATLRESQAHRESHLLEPEWRL